MIKAVYIHIPFCKNICSYCDFCKRYYDENFVNKYLDSLEKEVIKRYKGEQIETLYIGGGTPSSLKINDLKRLFDIISIFNLEKIKEFTFECNISDIDEEKMFYLYNNGVNRLSIGVETIDKALLKKINRYHTKEEIIGKIKLLRKIGFKNINIDLMYALPGETLSILEKDIAFITSLSVEHISAYSLIIDENTDLYINNVRNVSQELDFKMYNLINETLSKHGYIHYEISNYAKVGYESKHNLVYWQNEMYYGFGLGATGYVNNIRYTNTRSLKNYIMGNYELEHQEISLRQQMENEMILGLRKINGVNKQSFFNKYKKNIGDVFDIKDLLDNNYLIDDGINIYISDKYLYVQNSILVRFMEV